MTEITVLTFKRVIKINPEIQNLIPSSIEHWGILVNFERNTKLLYHADKTSLIDNSTSYIEPEEQPWSLNSDNKVHHRVLVGYSTNLIPKDMNGICQKVSKNRKFNTLTNNCQEWVKSCLIELVNDGKISPLCLEQLKENNEIIPLLGW